MSGMEVNQATVSVVFLDWELSCLLLLYLCCQLVFLKDLSLNQSFLSNTQSVCLLIHFRPLQAAYSCISHATPQVRVERCGIDNQSWMISSKLKLLMTRHKFFCFFSACLISMFTVNLRVDTVLW